MSCGVGQLDVHPRQAHGHARAGLAATRLQLRRRVRRVRHTHAQDVDQAESGVRFNILTARAQKLSASARQRLGETALFTDCSSARAARALSLCDRTALSPSAQTMSSTSLDGACGAFSR
jgi:hypothetical protein